MTLLRLFVLTATFLLAGCGGPVVYTMDPGEKVDPTRFDGAFMQYYLARGEIKATASFDEKSQILSVSIERQVSAYPDFSIPPLTLSYQHAQMSNDEVTVQLDGGLLKKVSSKTTDQTVAAVTALNALLGQVGSLQTAISKSKAATSKAGADGPICNGAMKVSLIVNVTYETSEETYVEKGHDKCFIKLTARVTYKGKAEGQESANILGMVGFPKDRSDGLVKVQDGQVTCREALCFRMTAGYTVIVKGEVRRKLEGNESGLPHDDEDLRKGITVRADVVAPHKSRVAVVRFNRRRFVTNETSISFTNGMVSEFSAKDPSEFVGFLQLPTEILKGVVLTVPLVK